MINEQKNDSDSISRGENKPVVGSSALKKYVLIVSQKFMSTHSKAGQPTCFSEKIKSGKKIHSIRMNYDLWLNRSYEINSGKAILSIREWAGRPYRSKQNELIRLSNIGVQKFIYKTNLYSHPLIGTSLYHTDKLKEVAKNDGLEYEDFVEWFKDVETDEAAAIIHLTDFRY